MNAAMPSEQLVSCARFWATRWPDRLALWCDNKSLTWDAFDRASDEIAAGLARAGVKKGDSIGILMHNRLEFMEAMFGAFKAGAAIVLLNLRYTPTELLHPISDASVNVVFADPDLLPGLAKARAHHPEMLVYTTDRLNGEKALDDLRLHGQHAPDIELTGGDRALICYTSGTTGTPKGAVLSHQSVVRGALARCLAAGMTYDDRVLLPMPLGYTGGCIVMLRDGIVPGATTYITSRSSADELLDLIETRKITVTAGVAVLFEAMMNHPRFATSDLSSLRFANTGGSAVTLHLLKTWQARGVSLTQGYGQTETAGTFITILYPDEAERKIGYAGRPLPHVQIRIVAPDGRVLPPHESGEILVRMPPMMDGYLNLPDQTVTAFEGGWLHTGDIGLLDEEGFLKIIDRSKDMLISGGLNVYPAEIEKTIGDIAGLEEFAVIGVPDPKWGETPLVVAPHLEKVDLAALRARCLEDLADYKRPKYVVGYGGPLPRTHSGKIQKATLRAAYPEAPPQAVRLRQ